MAQHDTTTDANAEGFSGPQLAALEALLAGETVALAAETAGVDRSTVYRWLRDPVFHAELRTRERARLGDISRTLAVAGRTAVVTLKDIAEREDAPLPVRVRAADALLSRLLQSHELTLGLDSVDEMAQRLATVEEALAEALGKPQAS